MSNKIYKLLTKFFFICYVIFSIYWGCIVLYNDWVKFAIYFVIIVLIGSLIYLIFNKIKFNLNKKVVIISLIILALLIRVMLLTLDYGKLFSDYATFYYNAVYVATGEGAFSSKYISAFPYLYGYIFILGQFMKLFGISYINVVALNIIFDMVGAIFMYLFSKKIDNRISIYALILWLFNPFNIFFSTLCSPVIIVNLLIIISLYITSLFLSKLDDKFWTIFYGLLLGIVLCIANIFRPIMIILIIAIFIYLVYISFSNKKIKKLNLIIGFLMIFSIYQVGNQLYFKVISDVTGYHINKSMSGWSIYVGSNKDASGQWSILNSQAYNEYYENDEYTPLDFDENLMKLGIERYKENGIKNNLSLLMKKSIILAAGVNSYNYNSFDYVNANNNKCLDNFVKIFSNLFWYLIIVLNIVFSVFCMKNCDYKKIIPYCLFIMGFCLASLIVEVSPRYFYPIFPALIFVSAISLDNIISFLKGSKLKYD